MGYRNDVAFQIKEEDYNKLLLYLEKLPQEDSAVSSADAEHYIAFVKNAFKGSFTDNETKWIVLYWDWVKFDEYYVDNEFYYIYGFITNNVTNYQFIRIGEDYDDIQEEYELGPYDESCISVSREIWFSTKIK